MPLLDDITHVIQVALTPVFLLTGVGSLLNVFSTRLGRVSDRVDAIAAQIEKADAQEAARLARQLAFLRRRSFLLDIAVVVASLAAASTCIAALLMFIGALRDSTVVSALFVAFGLALLCTVAAVLAFTAELVMAGRGLREEVAVRETEAASQVLDAGERDRLLAQHRAGQR